MSSESMAGDVRLVGQLDGDQMGKDARADEYLINSSLPKPFLLLSSSSMQVIPTTTNFDPITDHLTDLFTLS